MKTEYPLFSQVALAEDLPEYNLKRGAIATIVEHYPMAEGEDGYSLEGFHVPTITIEVSASQIVPIAELKREKEILTKLRWLSKTRRYRKSKPNRKVHRLVGHKSAFESE